MAARLWKKIGFLILILACLFNLIFKLVTKTPIVDELRSSATFMLQQVTKK